MSDEPRLQRVSEQAGSPLVRAEIADERHDDAHPEPKATFVLMLLFLMLLAGIWFYVFQLLLARQG